MAPIFRYVSCISGTSGTDWCILCFKQVGHGQREDMDASRVGTLKNPYLHYSFSKGFEDWFRKHNRYSTQEAVEGLMILRKKSIDWSDLFSIGAPTRRRRAYQRYFRSTPIPTVAAVLLPLHTTTRFPRWHGSVSLTVCSFLYMNI